MLPGSLAELRALPVKALKEAMGRLGLAAVAGSEKEDWCRRWPRSLGSPSDKSAIGESVARETSSVGRSVCLRFV